MINTAAHPTQNQVKKEFDSLADSIRQDLINIGNYGIVSSSKPSYKGSPLWCELASMISVLELVDNDIPIGAYIDVNSNLFTCGTDFQLGLTKEETAVQISNSINSRSIGVIASVKDGSPIVYINGVRDSVNVISSTDKILASDNNVIFVDTGSIVFPSGNVSNIKEKVSVVIPPSLIVENGVGKSIVLSIVARYGLSVSEYGTNVFNETVPKYYTKQEGSFLLSVENLREDGPLGDAISIAIVKYGFTETEESVEIDSWNDEYTYNRPWYSPAYTKHRETIGTGKITENNPHGISYNDIQTSGSTIHSQLMNQGQVVSLPLDIQDKPGYTKEYVIARGSVKVDFDGSITGSTPEYLNRYFVLPEIPIAISSVLGYGGERVLVNWIEGTPIVMLTPSTVMQDFIITYFSINAMEPSISEGAEGVSLREPSINEIVIAEGRSITPQDSINFGDVGSIDQKYDVYMNQNGEAVKFPSTLGIFSIEGNDGTLTTCLTRSRISVTLTGTPVARSIKCPWKTATLLDNGIVDTDCSIYQTYVLSKNGTKVGESLPNPIPLEIKKGAANYGSQLFINEVAVSLPVPMQESPYSEEYKHSYFGRIQKETLYTGSLGRVITIPMRTKDVVDGGVHIKLMINNIKDYSKFKIELVPPDITLGSGWLLFNGETSAEVPNSVLALYKSSNSLDGTSIDGTWRLVISDSEVDSLATLDYLEIKFYTAVFESAVYSVYKETIDGKETEVVKRIAVDNYNNFQFNIKDSGSTSELNRNSDFSVIIGVHGTASGKPISEELIFDPTFREQDRMNTLTTENVFDSISKYTIKESSTTGQAIVLANPVGSISNMCGAFSVMYKDNKVTNLRDIRNVGTSIRSKHGGANDVELLAEVGSMLANILGAT